jgi:tetratricopeptide (TPR) repeat protein
MTSRNRRLAVVAAVLIGGAAAAIPRIASLVRGVRLQADLRQVRLKPDTTYPAISPAIGMPGAPPTSADGLRDRIAEMETRVAQHPDDSPSALLLADALLRQARATTDGRPAGRAAVVLDTVLKNEPDQYDALRLLGAVHLSRHLFREALDVAKRARDARPEDAWNYGVMGDALLELGEYDEAFRAFDTMATLRPNADAYARVSYARELRGDLDGALDVMQMAADATSGHDREAKAWYTAHVGELRLRQGRLADAEREYRRAAFYFPDYPHAMTGLGKVKAARGDSSGALEIFKAQLERTPTLDLAARVGDLLASRGDAAGAEHYYRLAEDLAGPAAVQTEANLALFLAEHDRRLADAVRIAQDVSRVRHDIFTEDALAWTLFKRGDLQGARAASTRALRTGTRDERIVKHAEAIRAADLLHRSFERS